MSEPLKGGFSSFTTGTPFKPPGSAATQPSTGLFGNATAGANRGSTTQNMSTTSAFGTSGNTGTSLFGNLQAKPSGGTLFSGGPTTSSSGPATTTGAGTNLFSGFGVASTTPSTAQNTTSAPTFSSTPSFGGNLFGSKPPEQPASSNAPASSTTPQPSGPLFGASSGSTSAQPASAAASTTTNLFGKPATPSTSTPSPAPGASSGGNLFGNNLFGKKPDTPTTSSTPAPATSTAPSVFSGFGAKKDDGTDKDKQKDGTATPANVGSPLGQPPANKDAPSGTSGTAFNLFGQKPAEKKDAPTEGEKKDNTAAPPSAPIGTTASGTGTLAPAISVPPPSTLRGKTLEEIVNKWTSELDQHVGDFKKIAGEIAVWDRALIDNGNTIAALLQHVTLAEREQSDIEQTLKHMEDQQKELASTLEQYEKSSGEIFDSQSGGLRSLDVGPADAERDKHYTLAAALNVSLDDLSHSLLQMIESVNALSEDGGADSDGGRTRGDAPLEQIAQILSSHLESLQWIDGAVKEVETKVTDVERLVNDASMNSSRTTGGTASLSGSINGSRNSGTRGSRGFSVR